MAVTGLALRASIAGAQTAPAPAVASAPVQLPEIAWHAGDAVPAGYHTAADPRRWLVSAGASIFVLSYLASSVAATTAYDDPGGSTSTRGALWAPAAGPFIQMARESSAGIEVLLALDGVAQLGGLGDVRVRLWPLRRRSSFRTRPG